MKRKLKIAHIQLLPLLTGVQRVTLDELERLNTENFESFIICKEPGALTAEASQKNIECLYNKYLQREISFLKDILAFFYLYRLFRKHRFDVVHTHSSKTGVLGRIAAKLARVPMVVHTVHGFAFPAANSKLEGLIFLIMEWLGTKCSKKIICLHETDKKIAIDKLGAKSGQLEVVANGVDTFKYSPSSQTDKAVVRKELKIPTDAICIGMVGRLWKQKNPHALLDSAIDLLSSGTSAHFIFIGDGELFSELVSKAKNSGYLENIHFLGWRTDTSRLLNALDIFVLPSLWEGMPLAILEAQSKALPCIVSNIPGNNDLVIDNETGFLFELDNPIGLRECIKRLIENYDERQDFAKNARQKVLFNYDIDKRVEVVSNLYSKLIFNSAK